MDLSIITGDWPYDENEEANNVRKVMGVDGTWKVQVRIPDGLVQWNVEGRPDGQRPNGCPTLLEHCMKLCAGSQAQAAAVDEALIEELAQEMFDYCRRSRALLLLQDYCRALNDTLHCLKVLEFIRSHCPQDVLVFRYDRYRPSLLVDRARAEMLNYAREGRLREALDALNRGIQDVEDFYAEYEMLDQVADSAERQALVDLRRSFRERHNIPLNDEELLRSLKVEQEIAVRKENYEMAARLRDKINLLQQRIGSRR